MQLQGVHSQAGVTASGEMPMGLKPRCVWGLRRPQNLLKRIKEEPVGRESEGPAAEEV